MEAGPSQKVPFSNTIIAYHSDTQKKKLEDFSATFQDLLKKFDIPVSFLNLSVIVDHIVSFVEDRVGDFAKLLNLPVDSKLKKRFALGLIDDIIVLGENERRIVDGLINLLVEKAKPKDEQKSERPKTIFNSLKRSKKTKPAE